MKLKFLILTLATLLLLVGCSNLSAQTNPLDNNNYSIVEPYNNPNITLSFVGTRISGHSGLNRFSGTYEYKANAIKVSPLMMTRMAGDEVAMNIEQKIVSSLANNKSVKVVGDKIILTANDNSVLVYQKK